MGKAIHYAHPYWIIVEMRLIMFIVSRFVYASAIICWIRFWRRVRQRRKAILTTTVRNELLTAFLAEHGICTIDSIATMKRRSGIISFLILCLVTTTLFNKRRLKAHSWIGRWWRIWNHAGTKVNNDVSKRNTRVTEKLMNNTLPCCRKQCL